VNPEEDDIERFEEQRELELYREYRDIVPMFAYVVETERRFYLANTVELNQREDGWRTPPSLQPRSSGSRLQIG